MQLPLSLCYVTNRRDCKIEWFWDSLHNSGGGKYPIIVVDFWAGERDTTQGIWKQVSENARHVSPKPSVWAGPFRLTSENWFCPASFRNTGLCFCKTSHIAYCDDLSVLETTWLPSVEEAVRGNYIALGAYKKVRLLQVENGYIKSYEDHPAGLDTRWPIGSDIMPVSAHGGLMYGCSVAMPVEALLSVNGWDENCDGCGSEDYCTGIRMSNAGFTFKYVRSMLTLESEEDHHKEPAFKRTDKGVSPNDKSHRLLHNAMTEKWCPNFFGEGGIRALRESVLAGNPFPPVGIPQHDFFDGQKLSDM